MANSVISKQELIDAQKDAETLAQVANGPAGQLVKSRNGREYYTLATFPNISVYSRDETYKRSEIDTAVATVAGGKYSFTTYAKFDAAKATVAVNSMVNIDEAPTGTTTWGQGLNTWDGVTLSGSVNDPLAQSKTYTDGLVKSKALGTSDLNSTLTEGTYHQQTASNATAERNYPAHAQNANSTLRVVAMTANTIMQIIEAAGKTSTRMIFSASTIPSFQAWSTTLGAAEKIELEAFIGSVNTARKEFALWHVSGSNGKVSFDKSTKVLSWNNALIAAFNNISKRIQIAAGSATFVNTYDTLFLDLNSVPSTGTVTSSDFAACLKVAKYSDGAATAFIQKNNQLALAYLNPQGEVVPAIGFCSIDSGNKIKDTFTYTKIADRITFYHPASNGNLIKYLLRHDVKAFDGVSNNSQIDLWRLERAIEVNAALTDLQEIVTYGELEFTMREKEYPADHVGGVHGDEVITSAYFLVDGVYKDAVSWIGSGEAKEIRLQLKSVIYRLNTQVAIAEHYKELIITKNGITANQWIETLILLNPDRFWLAMMPTNRVAANSVQVSTRDIRDGVVRDVTSAGFTQIYTPLKNGSYVNVSGDKYSTSVEITNLQGVLSTADIYVANDAAYNKIYVSAIGGASSGVALPAGTKISWTTKYKVDAI